MKLSTPISRNTAQYQAVYEAGFRYVNYDFPNFSIQSTTGMDYMGDDWQEVSRKHLECIKAAGLTPIQAHGPFCYPMPEEAKAPFIASCIRAIECCKEMEIPQIVLHPHASKGMSYDQFLSENRDYFRQLIPAAEKTGVWILIENIGQFSDPHYVHDGKELRTMIETVEHPLFAACWDTGHANHIMEDQCESLRVLGNLLKGLHINDNLGDLEPREKRWMNDMHTLPMFGTVDFDGIIRTLKEIGYKGYFNFETDKPRGHQFKEGDKLKEVMPEMKKHTLVLLNHIGRLMLGAYDCLEE